MQRRFMFRFAAALGAATLLASFGAQADETIKVGVTGGPHEQVMEVVKQYIESKFGGAVIAAW